MAESIYNLLPKETVGSEATTSRYTSKFAGTVRSEANKVKEPGALYGPPGNRKPDPKNFTKKGAGETIRMTVRGRNSMDRSAPISQTVLAPASEPRLDKATLQYVPRKSERGTIAPRTKKDFLKENAKNAVKSNRTQSLSQVVGTKRGEVPAYLKTMKETSARESLIAAQLATAAANDNGLQRITDDERDELLTGLKSNYKELYTQYLHLSVVIDTASKRAEKGNMEAKLAELEADIAKLERSTDIFVAV